jgi:DNA-binding NarL/FixJ family response regulator
VSEKWGIKVASGRFLIIEDDRLVVGALTRLLKPFGQISSASSATAGREMFGPSQKWDALFVDIGLPDGSGLEVLAHARAAGCDSPALVLSATYVPSNINRAFDLGARYLVKPFDPQRITAFVREVASVGEGNLEGTTAGWAKRYSLTPAEAAILEAAVEGATHEELLEDRGISRGTLKKHVQHLLKKTGDPSLLAATARLLRERVSS